MHSSSTSYLIETFGLTKFFGEQCVVHNLNLQVPSGTIFGFLGPNGAGKSTTIKLILDLLRPTFGKIKIFGLDSILYHREIMTRIGYQPEKPILYENLNAFSFLKYMARLYGFSPKDAYERAKNALEFVNLGRKAFTVIKNLSAGQKQRLALAQAIINDPELLILDEPTSNLDPLGRIEIMDKIKELVKEKNMTVFISSHILPEIERVCDYVAVINNGRLVLQGKISDLVKNVKDTLYMLTVSDPGILKPELEKLEYVKEITLQDNTFYISIDIDNVELLWKDVPKLVSSLNLVLREFKSVRSPLEKSFLDALGVKDVGGHIIL
ncbi:MAG: ABC transporter ATP-binding protein [Candidatus Asgardarchaeia archaeon]